MILIHILNYKYAIIIAVYQYIKKSRKYNFNPNNYQSILKKIIIVDMAMNMINNL